ncbi:flagellar FliJ family protein [Rosenbergiella australiborealis]|uniref:flagellar FliJ family protein n=1 Tax=Rosenbergiella australiborealis TaxID=1544696 RepID=UPI001F4D7606|nr:flagellar FliJ family protein [Rosenbergiella australiborealis]
MSHATSLQLKALERLRRQRRQQCQRLVIEQQQHVQQMTQKLSQLQNFIDTPTPTVTTALALGNQEAYTQALRHVWQWQQQQCQQAEQELQQRKARLNESHLQEKQLEHYCLATTLSAAKADQRQAQKHSDELAALRFSRKD